MKIERTPNRCPYCGEPAELRWRICPVCGEELPPTEAQFRREQGLDEEPPQWRERETIYRERRQRSPVGQGFGFGMGCFLFLIVLFVVMPLLFGGCLLFGAG